MSEAHESLTEETAERVILYAVGALDAGATAEFEAHLKAGCAICEAELSSFQRVTERLSFSAPQVSPPPRVREKLLAQILAQEEFDTQFPSSGSKDLRYDQSGLLILHSSRLAWESSGIGEIQTKELYFDPARKYATRLIGIPAGTHFPDHRHVEVEEVYVLEGDLHVGGHTLKAGDYCRAEPGTTHHEVFTVEGCLLLVHSSVLDEVISENTR